MSDFDVSVVMPCLNEAASVAGCVEQARTAMSKAGLAGEVVIADNGSTDGSPDIAARAGARVVIVERRGYGAAYLGGLSAARGRYIVMGDADGTYDFNDIPAFVNKLKEGNDLVIGSRFAGTILPGAMPWLHQYIGNPVLTGILGIFFGQRVSDAHCGMRAMTREANERMGLRTTGMEYASEMIAMAIRRGLKVGEIPIIYHPREGESKLRSFRDGWRHLRFMLLLSPTPLFLIPGLAATLIGLAALLILLPGAIRFAGMNFDFHFMFVGSALAILGVQLLVLGLAAKAVARSELQVTDKWIAFLDAFFTLERGILLGAALLAAGIGVNAWILVEWLRAGRGTLFAVRPALLGLSLVVMGAQLGFGSFFISLVRGDSRS
ncbi:MAG TPA: glycosyltransferase family 2 protein [Gemmatimonadales bacterium]|jgi:glycosyltransferase involved in cell wall biosynthesis